MGKMRCRHPRCASTHPVVRYDDNDEVLDEDDDDAAIQQDVDQLALLT